MLVRRYTGKRNAANTIYTKMLFDLNLISTGRCITVTIKKYHE